MAINITRAAAVADLRENLVIKRWSTSYKPDYMNAIQFGLVNPVGGLYVDRNGGFEDKNRLHECWNKQGLDMNLGSFEYHDEDIPLNYYCILNPAQPGAQGIRLEYSRERFFIVSGGLSGCGYAVLKDNDRKIYVIHAGANEDTGEEVVSRRKRINCDIFRAAMILKNGVDPQNGGSVQMEYGELASQLDMNGFHGYVYTAGEIRDYYKRPNIVLRRYCVTSWNHDVICVINEQGNLSIALRGYDDNEQRETCYYAIHALQEQWWDVNLQQKGG